MTEEATRPAAPAATNGQRPKRGKAGSEGIFEGLGFFKRVCGFEGCWCRWELERIAICATCRLLIVRMPRFTIGVRRWRR